MKEYIYIADAIISTPHGRVRLPSRFGCFVTAQKNLFHGHMIYNLQDRPQSTLSEVYRFSVTPAEMHPSLVTNPGL